MKCKVFVIKFFSGFLNKGKEVWKSIYSLTKEFTEEKIWKKFKRKMDKVENADSVIRAKVS